MSIEHIGAIAGVLADKGLDLAPWALGIGGAMYAYSIFPRAYQENGLWYNKYAASSFPNPLHTESGYRWATTQQLNNFTRKRNEVFIDEFRFDDKFCKDVKMPKFHIKSKEKTKVFFNKQDLVEGMLIVGKMKSGKSEIYNSILSQDWYDRAIIHSIKISFEKWGYDRNSIILNPYLEKSHLWDVMSESHGTIQTFFKNYLNGVLGDKKDFFSASSERIFKETMTQIKTHYKDATSAQKWLLFIKAVKAILKEETESNEKNEKKTNKDVKATMESILEPLEIMAFEMQKGTKKTFVIADFFKMKNGAKLFLSNQPEYLDALTPLFSAFTAAVGRYHTTLAETTTDYTVYALDEYLSFVNTMDTGTRKILHTLIRGYGGIMMPAVQYLPVDDKALMLDLTSSAFVWFYFSTIEEETKDILINKTETEYWYKDAFELRRAGSNDKQQRDHSKTSKTKNLLSKNILDGLGAKFEHIVYIPTHNLLYKGYTPRVELVEKFQSFKQVDLEPFYKIKYQDTLKLDAEQVAALKFEDLYKDVNELSKQEKFRLHQSYKNATDKTKFKQDNNLVDVNLDLFFKEFEQDDQILDNQMNILTMQERFALYTEWNNFGDEDTSAKFDFIEKHNLWGALPGIFDFNDSDLNEHIL